MNKTFQWIFLILIVFSIQDTITGADSSGTGTKGSFYTDVYPNLFKDLLNKSENEINSKIEKAFYQLFYGDDNNQRVYYPVENERAYIKDILSNDVRTEGMSYGMMIAVQLNKKNEFDRIWKWAKTYMQHKVGQRKNYFAWHCKSTGEILDSNSASDGEIWFVTSLFFASSRWGDGEGIFNYKSEALQILDAMLNKVENSDDPKVVTNIFNKKEKMVVFVPVGEADDFTDPSYHVPHFYELWLTWAVKNNNFWSEAAGVSREYFKKAANPLTGLMPDYSAFDGTPVDPFGGGKNHFQYDSWRVAMNIAIDHIWFNKDDWQIDQSNRLLKFFHNQGIGTYGNLYTLEGENFGKDHSPGLVAMNAVAALAATYQNKKEFIEELWNLPVPEGPGRYYDGMLYMLGMLQVSGNFRIYHPE